MTDMLLERLNPVTAATDGYVTVDTVPGLRGDGTPYDHKRVRIGRGLGAVVVPVTRVRGIPHVGVVEQHRPVIDQDTFEFPRGGTHDLGAAEALRELREETGIDLGADRVRHVGNIRPDTGILQTEVAVWIVAVPADMLPATAGRVENESGAVVSWMPAAQFRGLILGRRGRVWDDVGCVRTR